MILLAGLFVGQGGAPANLVVWESFSGGLTGAEGHVTFFAVYAAGNPGAPVAEKRLGDERCIFWPSGSLQCDAALSRTGDTTSFSLNPGNYELRSYHRECNGNCGNLDRSAFECRQPFSVKSGEALDIRRDASQAACTLTSTPTRLQPLGAADLSGRVMRADGTPAARVRIAAIRRELADKFGTVPVTFQGAETDNTGQYLLQNVPEGDYYLAMLEEKRKTFFPGVVDAAAATLITIHSRQATSRYDFSIPDR